MSKPNLCGYSTVEQFREHTALLLSVGGVRQLKDAADEMAAKYAALWNLSEEMQDQTKGQ